MAFINPRLFLTAAASPLLYLTAAVLNVYVGNDAGTAALLWCAASVLLTVLLRHRPAVWPAIALAAACGDFAAHIFMGTSALVAAAVVAAEILEICLTATLVRYLNLGECWYQSLRCGVILLLSSIACAFVGTAVESVLIHVSVGASFQPDVKIRFATETLNLLVTLPLVLSWTDSSLLAGVTVRKVLEIVTLTAASALAIYMLFASGNPFLFLAIPILLLATLRGRLLASTLTVAALYIVVMQFSFDSPDQIIMLYDVGKTKMLVVYYLFVLTALLSTVPLGALLVQAEKSAEELRVTGAAADQARREAEAARDRAEAAGRVKSDFLSAMSHELRTPMTGVLGLVDLLSKEKLTSKQLYYIDNIRSSGRHLLDVINDILDFSKIDSGKLEVESIAFATRPLFDSVCATVQPLCREKHIEFRSEIPSDLPDFVRGDPTRIRQVLLNLVGNAIKFTERGLVKVAISHRQVSGSEIRLRFEVRDTGIGIAQEKQPEIFNAFTQEDRSTARRFGGSGLGLAICKRLVLAMGGQISFTSTPDLGSIFWFEIPTSVCAADDVLPTSREFLPNKQNLRILVAEDISLNRSIINAMLSVDHHNLTFAQNGAEVLELVKKNIFDLILMDVQMPVMDGVEATQRIRTLNSPARDTPIIAVTANVVGRERDRYLAAGMDACIPKPIDWDELNDAIARYASGGVPVAINARDSERARPEPPLLIDSLKLESLRRKLDSDFEKLIHEAFEQAEHACERIESIGSEFGDYSGEAHALKGMAGMFGLLRLQRYAEELESGRWADEGAESIGAELRAVIAETRAAASERGFFRDRQA
jgi:signal transduction histidine kinase/CheY-like chemotaxis protein/HPt (histidine-containing phosphotransfer) domain-containing protein